MRSLVSTHCISRESTERLWIAVALLILALGPSGCGNPGGDLPVGSYERGVAEYEGHHFFDAIEDLRLFIRRNPTDPRADDAQYHVGLARFEHDDLPVAAVEFEILRSDYPNSELVDDAFYMEGLCYTKQVPSIDLEQTITRKALSHFQRYLREFPQGTHRSEVLKQVEELQLHLDRKAMAAVDLYVHLDRPRAALVTLQALMEERPDSKLRPGMLLLEGKLHLRLKESSQARHSWSELLRDYPDDALAAEARVQLEKLPDARGDASQ